MEQIQHQNLKISSRITRFQFLKKITQFLVSVSVFYLLLSNSSRFSFLHSFNLSFSTVPIQLFSHITDKNCLFLLCNGLLVFVAKFSGPISSSGSKHRHNSIDRSIKNYEDDDGQPLVVEKEDFTAQENTAAEEEGRENEQYVIRQEVGDGDKVQVEEKESEAMIEEEAKEFAVQEEEEEENDYEIEEENGMLSTEELNKKFEEFIGKMKEEIRLEAQQQLVMVN